MSSIHTPVFPEGQVKYFVRLLGQRKDEIANFLNLGRCLVVCPIAVAPLHVAGAGEERQIDPNPFLPWGKNCLKPASGENMTAIDTPAFAKFHADVHGHVRYRACFKEPIGNPILFVHQTRRVVACHEHRGNGHVLYLPPPLMHDDKGDKVFVDAIIALLPNLPARKTDEELPP